MAEASTKLTTSDGELGDLLKCPICQDVCEEPRILSCQHIACTECINNWIRAKKGQLWCPECNQQRELPAGGAESLPHSFRLNDLCGILKEKLESGEEGSNCKLHSGKPLSMICFECEVGVCDSCRTSTEHTGHMCADAKQVLELKADGKAETAKNYLIRIDQLKQELEKSKEDDLDVLRDFKKRSEFAHQRLLQEMEKNYQEKVKVLGNQEKELEEYVAGMRSFNELTKTQDSMDVSIVVDQLKSLPKEESLRPKTTSYLKVEMVHEYMKMLFSDGETKCGKVLTSGVAVPNQSVIAVTSDRLTAGEAIHLQLLLKDDRGRKVVTEREDVLSVEVCTVDKRTIPLEPQKQEGGHFTISFTPSFAGWYVLTAKAFDKMIPGSPLQLKVEPRGIEMKEIAGEAPSSQLHDVLKVGDNFMLVDKTVIMMDKNGKLIQSFENKDWYFYPYSIAMHKQCYYVTAMKGQVVIMYQANGKEVRRFGGDVLKRPTGIALDKEGNIYVADNQLSKILLFGPDGKFKEYVISTEPSRQTMSLNNPWFIKFNSKGQLIIADFENQRIQVINVQTGREIMSIMVMHEGQKMYCRGVDVDRHDNIYVGARADKSGNPAEGIFVYGPDGTYLGSLPAKDLHWSRGIHIAKDGQHDVLYVVDSSHKSVRTFQL